MKTKTMMDQMNAKDPDKVLDELEAKRKQANKIKAAIKLLKDNGYTVEPPPPETEYQKAIRTGVKPAIWPPIVMTRAELQHFRQTHGLV